jgi:hypothetical protein
MPRTHPSTPTRTRPVSTRSTSARLAPVPIAVLLPPPAGSRPPSTVSGRRGLSGHAASQVIARYTHHGDLVIDLDASPSVAAAAGWLARRVVSGAGSAVPELQPGAARLAIATLPRPSATSLASITEWMRRTRGHLVAPGGFLLIVVSAITGAGRSADLATTIIAAAAAAGLSWHQQLLDVHIRLPEHEPRAEPDTAAAVPARLIRGRHRRVHTDLYCFTTTGGEDIDA